MGEEAMWKSFYEQMQEKAQQTSVFDDRIQELDGGFFEKFGSQLKEEIDRKDDDAIQMCRVADLGADPTGMAPGQGVVLPPARMDGSDSEAEETVKNELISDAMGWNIEELYSEVLYYLQHNVGCDVGGLADRDALCRLLQDAFKIDDEKHHQLLASVEEKEAPKIVLNVEVMEAQELKPKDANGMCDPFCTLYLSSSPTHRYNTSVKQKTLSPAWEEHFSLPVQSPSDDVLFVEVWDFDPAETVREKMGKFTDVKGARGLRKLMKEIAVTASTGKHDNEYIGTAQVSLNCIATGGQTQWVNLEKKNKTKKQGVIKLRMTFSAEKNAQVARQEHRRLLGLMLLHHLDGSKLEPYEWSGEFDDLTKTIIRQHAVQSGLSSTDEALARWIEFCTVHIDHPLSFTLFADLALCLQRAIMNGNFSSEEVKQFWESSKKLLPSCLNSIRRLRKLSNCDKSTLIQLTGILKILSTLASLKPSEDIDLFPSSVYGWISNLSEGSNCDIYAILADAVKQGAEDWMSYVLENNSPDGNSEEDALRHLIKVVQLVRSDLQKAIEYHDKIFLKVIQISYSSSLFRVYEAKVCELVEPVVKEVCSKLRPLRFNDTISDGHVGEEEPLSMGTTLFELYLALQRLSLLGDSLCPNEHDSLCISKFHAWFHRGVAQWLDIALYKALQRVEKAVELDMLVPVDASVKYSSSAVDTFAIFYQIKIFWQQLSWPDVEGSYSFVAKIIDDICRCSVFYADKMSQKVDGLGESDHGTVHEKKFQVTQEWCLAINNIEYVRQSIQPFVAELGMDNILASLADYRSATAADHCRQTLKQIIDNSVDTVRNKIIDLLVIVADKMEPAVVRFLQEGAELLNQDSNAVDRLMQYLDENLVMLNSHLNTDNFERILSIMWEHVSNVLLKLVENSLERRKPPSFFSNLHETLNILIGFFRQGDLEQQLQEQQRQEQVNGITVVGDTTDDPGDKHRKLRHVERILRLHGMETPDLVHQYHVQRLMEQKKLQTTGDAPYHGLLTVRAQFVEDKLRIEIMNARNIKPMDSNGSCDPYVKVHFLPEEKFTNITKPRTKTHKKSLFPLFDEIFTIPLSPEQKNIKDGMIAFILKDQDFLGNEFIAETYLSLEDIPENDVSIGLETLPQIHLKLNRPMNTSDSEVLKALEHRQGDKLARDFVKRMKTKLGEGKQSNGNGK